MGKLFIGFLLFIAGVLTVLYFASPYLLSIILNRTLGVPVNVGYVQFGLFSSEVALYDVELKNPPGFISPSLAKIPEIYAQADLRDLTKGILHLQMVRFTLSDVSVERAANGAVNLAHMGVIKTRSRSAAPISTPRKNHWINWQIQVDELHFNVTRVHYLDHAQNGSSSQDFDLQLYNQVIHHVTNPKRAAVDIVGLVLDRLGMGGLLSTADFANTMAEDSPSGFVPIRSNLPVRI
jgi:hypothetical protein